MNNLAALEKDFEGADFEGERPPDKEYYEVQQVSSKRSIRIIDTTNTYLRIVNEKSQIINYLGRIAL